MKKMIWSPADFEHLPTDNDHIIFYVYNSI